MNKDLDTLREQLKLASTFMETTKDPDNPHRGAWWWAGDMPAHPDEYEPEDWEKMNKPIWQVWNEYLYELKCCGLYARLNKALELPIADLLADTTCKYAVMIPR